MEEIPESVMNRLTSFHRSLDNIEEELEPHLSHPFEENLQHDPVNQAQMDFMSIYTINSLYWIHLCTKGEKPNECELLMEELNRLKGYMKRLKVLQERHLAPKINKVAAKNFLRNALWTPESSSAGNEQNDSNCQKESNSMEKVRQYSQKRKMKLSKEPRNKKQNRRRK